jgi:hypothetical protein
MMKNIFFCTLCVFLLASCQSDKPEVVATDTPAKTVETPATPKSNEEIMADLKGTSVDEKNIAARVTRGMDKLMEEYKMAAETMDGFDNPSYTVDEKCNVVFSYEERGTKYAKHFNIGDLEHRNGRMTLEADNGDDIKFPGFRVATGNGEASVTVYKDGKEYQKDNEWYVVLANRKSVENAAPNVVNLINICQKVRNAE